MTATDALKRMREDGKMTEARANALGYWLHRGAYQGTGSDVHGRWYVGHEGRPVDVSGQGHPSRAGALDAIREHEANLQERMAMEATDWAIDSFGMGDFVPQSAEEFAAHLRDSGFDGPAIGMPYERGGCIWLPFNGDSNEAGGRAAVVDVDGDVQITRPAQ